jgi:hypothetical protein
LLAFSHSWVSDLHFFGLGCSQYYDSLQFVDGKPKPGAPATTAALHVLSVWVPLVETDDRPGGVGCLEVNYGP